MKFTLKQIYDQYRVARGFLVKSARAELGERAEGMTDEQVIHHCEEFLKASSGSSKES